MSRIWWFRGALLLAAPLTLMVVEGGLRLLPPLRPPPLVIDLARHENRILRSTNAEYAKRFFFERYGGALIASGRLGATPFLEGASPRPWRIVFVGASTVQGYPHPSRLAAAAFLQAMLDDALPGRPVQVLNLGITSLASYAVARVVDDALRELSPDLVVVYSGHNEFYGIYGSGAGGANWGNGVHYRLMGLSTARLLQAGIESVRGREVSDRPLLEIQARHGGVPVDSPRRAAAAAALRRNLEDMARACRAADTPLVLCTLAANDAGFAPAGAAPDAPSPDWSQEVAAAEELLGLGGEGAPAVTPERARRARPHLDRALTRTPTHAYLWFLEGRAQRALDRADSAAAAFRRARDYDTMPWRAPTAHSAVIRQVADRAGTTLADVERAFAAAAPAGVDWGLMADHVHPAVAGQALLARTVVSALVRAGQIAVADSARTRSDGYYRELLGDLPVERAGTLRAMADLLSAPPMDRYNGAGARRLRREADDQWARLPAEAQRGAIAWQRSGRGEVPLVMMVADELFRGGKTDAARSHYRASMRQSPYTPRGDLWAAVQWAWCRRLGGVAPATAVLDAARRRVEFIAQAPGVSVPFMDMVRGELDYFLGDREAAREHLTAAFAADSLDPAFYYTLVPPLLDLLVRDRETETARRTAEAAMRATRNPYFGQLVQSLEAGGHFLPPVATPGDAG